MGPPPKPVTVGPGPLWLGPKNPVLICTLEGNFGCPKRAAPFPQSPPPLGALNLGGDLSVFGDWGPPRWGEIWPQKPFDCHNRKNPPCGGGEWD